MGGMRIGLLALAAWALAASVAGEPATPATTTGERAPATAASRPAGPAGLHPPAVDNRVTPLSVAECRQLGGLPVVENYGLCNSHAYCETTDENGNQHRVCLTTT